MSDQEGWISYLATIGSKIRLSGFNMGKFKQFICEEPHLYLFDDEEGNEFVYDLEAEKDGSWIQKLANIFKYKAIPDTNYKGHKLSGKEFNKEQMDSIEKNARNNIFLQIALKQEFKKEEPNVPEDFYKYVPDSIQKLVIKK